jgi:hypothetical protein
VLNLLWPSLACAQEVQTAFNTLNRCLLGAQTSTCRTLMTEDSRTLYDRVNSYDVMECLPKETRYVSQHKSGQHQIVRASTKLGESERFLRLAFRKEGGAWKLDVPFSLHSALGQNWQKQVQMTEQLYLFMRSQIKGKLNCEAVHALAAGPRKQKAPPEAASPAS